MNGLRLFIDRPVFATVLNLIVILIGVVSLNKLTVREYPQIDVPVVSVVTQYTGASAYIIESQVTDVLEESLSGIDGVDFISSKSFMGQSRIDIHFELDRDADGAASDVRDRVARVRKALPDEISEPVVSKAEAQAAPLMYLTLTSTIRPAAEVNDYAQTHIKDVLQTIPGIAEIRVLGSREHAMRIWLQKDKMAAYKITPEDIEKAIRSQNVELPAGLIESRDTEFSVHPVTDLMTAEEFQNIVVKEHEDYQILLSDVARVELGVTQQRTFARYNGETATAIGIVKQATANPIDVSREVHKRVKRIIEELPDDMSMAIPLDISVFIEGSISAVWSTLAEAFILVLLVIYLFLGSARATIIPMAAIPVSLIGAFSFIWFMGFSLNTLSLLALVLAIGLVVDDAIVMLENIYRHLEMGKKPVKAAIDGAKEMGFPVVAMTLTLAAVFAPVAFAEGKTGKLFTEFALTLAGAVLVSGFVALTWSPMLCSKLLKSSGPVEENHNVVVRAFESFINWLKGLYHGFLDWVMAHRWFSWLILIVSLLLCASLIPIGLNNPFYQPLQDELAPIEDRGYFFTIAMAPEGATPAMVARGMRAKEAVYDTIPEVRGYMVVAGWPDSTQGISFAPLTPYEERERHSKDIAMDATKGFFMMPDLVAFAMPPQGLGDNSSTPISTMIQTTGSYEELEAIGNQMVAAMNANPGINQVRMTLSLNKPELVIEIDRKKAADLGVDIDEISRALETLLGSRKVTRFKKGDDQFDVILQMEASQRSAPQDINDIYLRTADGDMVSLNNLVTLSYTTTASDLPHFNKYRAAQITAGVTDGYTIGQAVQFMEETLAEISPETRLDYRDNTREFVESGNTLLFAFMLAIMFIYLVLSAQFESFVDPFIILTTIVPAFIGALIALKFADGTLNLFSKIGLITLVGLITKHGILMVEFANHAVEQGKDKVSAIKEAAETRFRPILMTAAATVLGAIPLALASGPGAESRQEIGWVIVGGLSLGTFLTLIIIPVVYVQLSRRKPLPVEG